MVKSWRPCSSIGIIFCAVIWMLIAPLPKAQATAKVDRQYSLETVGILRPWDNMDGLFVDYLTTAYQDYFNSQSRFKLQDISKADAILQKTKLPYYKVIDDPEILMQLSRSMHVETLIRTKLFKEGRQFRFTLDWIHSPRLDVLASHSFSIPEPEPGKPLQLEQLRSAVRVHLTELFSKVPFLGHVTGRDKNWVTVNIGRGSHLKKGDTLVISTLDEVKKHPLLKAIVDWRFTQVGQAVVDQLEESIAFAKITQEEPGARIDRYQKVVRIIPLPEAAVEQQGDPEADEEKERKLRQPPRFGWVTVGPWLGGVSREFSTLNETQGKTGGSFLAGAKVDSELWLNRSLFGNLNFAFGAFSYSQEDIQTGKSSQAQGTSASAFRFQIDMGYSYLFTGEFYGPKGWLKAGYHSLNYRFTSWPAESLSPTSFGALFVGIGADLPTRYSWGFLTELDVGVFRSYHEEVSLGTGVNTGLSDIGFGVGTYYRFAMNLAFRLNLDILANSADFDGGTSVNQKIISVTPSIQYFF